MKFFKKNKNEYNSVSLTALTWKRFKKEWEGMISLGFIIIVILISVLGYLITPDSTPYCNHQQLEIALRKPGFTVKLLQVNPGHEVPKVNLVRKMLFGQPTMYQTIPISAWRDKGEFIEVQLFEQDDWVRYDKTDLADKPVTTRKFILGTDRYGRDVLSQLMMGSRVSLSVGFLSIFIALIIGILVGAVAGYYRGKVDDVLMFIINVV